MLELIPGVPDNVVAVKAVGEIEDDDYEDVLVPAIEDRLDRHDKIRLLLLLGSEFEGFEADAMWEDAKLGLKTFSSYEKIAIVTDATWVRRSVKSFGWLIPGDVKVFPLVERESAQVWVAG